MTKEDILLTYIRSTFERDTIFFTEDCAPSGLPPRDIRLYLSSLVQTAEVVRLARGVFLYPDHEEFSMKIRMPSVDRIAYAIANREHIRISPCEDQCAYLVGLTTLQVSPYKYITDGGDRVVHLQNGRTLEFAWRKESRIFSFNSVTMQRLTLGMRALGKDNIRLAVKYIIAGIL